MKKLLIPILLLIAQYSFSQVVIPQRIPVLNSGGSGGKVDSSIYSTKANVNNVADSVLSLVPVRSLTTTGTNGAATLISGVLNIPQYTGGTGTTTYVKQGYGMKVDSSAGNKYTVNADTSVLKNTTNLNAPLFFRAIDTSINADTTTAITGLATKDWVSKHGGGGGGTVTSISRTDGYGIISSVINPTTTPNITSKVDTTVITSKTFLSNTLSSYFQLPALTSGSVLFSDGTTIVQDPTSFTYVSGLLKSYNFQIQTGGSVKGSTGYNLIAGTDGSATLGSGAQSAFTYQTSSSGSNYWKRGSTTDFTINSSGNILVNSIKSGSTRPTISGATQNVITDANGQLSFGTTAQTTLVSGTKAISITGVTASSKATVSFVSIGGTVSTTWQYAIVCTSGTVTITALTNAGTTDTSDTSTLTYTVTP